MITLATLPDASAQAVFDQVKTHLLTQKQQSLSNSPSGLSVCAYRGINGLKCAVGCLISDEEYQAYSHMEGFAWDSDYAQELMPQNHAELITALQDLHDMNPVSRWSAELQHIATRHGLEWKV